MLGHPAKTCSGWRSARPRFRRAAYIPTRPWRTREEDVDADDSLGHDRDILGLEHLGQLRSHIFWRARTQSHRRLLVILVCPVLSPAAPHPSGDPLWPGHVSGNLRRVLDVQLLPIILR